MTHPTEAHKISEAWIIAAMAAVQFYSVLEFMMVMPLGPDFARDLGIPAHHLGWIGGSYTAAAAISGLLAAMVIDRFDRRQALIWLMAGLGIATALAGLAQGLSDMIGYRVLAGIFGGPTTAVALAAVADVVPPERRGRAVGKTMGGFALASIAGVPLSLEIAQYLGWRNAFLIIAMLGFAIMQAVRYVLPPLTGHLQGGLPAQGIRQHAKHWRGFLIPLLATMSGFMIIPNISAFVQYNLGYPRDQLALLFFAGGLCSLLGMRLAGYMTDRYSSTHTISLFTLLYLLVLVGGFAQWMPWLPVLAMFIGFMMSMSSRSVAIQTLMSKVPPPESRAGFMTLSTVAHHVGSATGAFLSTLLLTETATHQLQGMGALTLVASLAALAVPFLAWHMERKCKNLPAPEAEIIAATGEMV